MCFEGVLCGCVEGMDKVVLFCSYDQLMPSKIIPQFFAMINLTPIDSQHSRINCVQSRLFHRGAQEGGVRNRASKSGALSWGLSPLVNTSQLDN
jgi:hypothetical protein